MGVRLICVDGTNLVRTAYGYGGPEHAAQEDADARRLVEIFARLCEDCPALEVELFFDGAFRVMPAPRPANLRVSFARDGTADDLILDRIRAKAWGATGSATVVTADAELGRRAESEGGRWMRAAHGVPPESVVGKIRGKFSR